MLEQIIEMGDDSCKNNKVIEIIEACLNFVVNKKLKNKIKEMNLDEDLKEEIITRLRFDYQEIQFISRLFYTRWDKNNPFDQKIDDYKIERDEDGFVVKTSENEHREKHKYVNFMIKDGNDIRKQFDHLLNDEKENFNIGGTYHPIIRRQNPNYIHKETKKRNKPVNKEIKEPTVSAEFIEFNTDKILNNHLVCRRQIINENLCYIIYKTTCLIENKFYIGQHKKYRDDNYIGSGVIITEKIKKFGKKNFKSEILEVCDEDNVNKKETFWINKLDATNPEIGYNIKTGA